jgi:hypothetical protein
VVGKSNVAGAVVAFRDSRERPLAEDASQRTEEQHCQSQKMEAIGCLADLPELRIANLHLVVTDVVIPDMRDRHLAERVSLDS